jgi:hypothetical protein
MRSARVFIAVVAALLLAAPPNDVAAARASRVNTKSRKLRTAPHITEKGRQALEHAARNHRRYYPDFKYEGFDAPHGEAEQKPEDLHRGGTGPHDVTENPHHHARNFKATKQQPQQATATTATLPANPHMANASDPYPDNLMWLLNIFESGYGLPRSYNDVLPNGQVYWASKTYLSVGAFDASGKHTTLDSMIGIQERTLTRFGLNLYDAATWQIALSLWGLYDVAHIYESNILYVSTTGPGDAALGEPSGLQNIRSDSQAYKYGPQKVLGNDLKVMPYPANSTHFPSTSGGTPGTPVKKGPGAMFYRIIGPMYDMPDPMMGSFGAAWKYPWPNYDKTTTWNTLGIIHFNDWKPITGENVWATMLGPLQSLGLATRGNLTNTICGSPYRVPQLPCDFKTFDSTPPQVQLGISILPALLALQSDQGSLFHCPWGAKIFPPDPEEGDNVSNENNFSGYASLTTLLAALTNFTGGTSSDEILQWALMGTKQLVDGLDKWFDSPSIMSPKGQLPNGWQVIPQGGHINASGYFPVPMDTVGGLAVDCQTWGMTVLGQPRIDKAHGFGTAYNIWQIAKHYAGHYVNGTIAGVGYTDTSSIKNGSSVPVHTIWSAEWSFGAINMAQTLSGQYAAAGDAAKAADLLKDAQDMYDATTSLWPKGLRFPDGSYVYANERFFIPWGWFANPISALCSTAWSVLQEQNFDPFHYGGGNKPPLKKPDHLHAVAPPSWRY